MSTTRTTRTKSKAKVEMPDEVTEEEAVAEEEVDIDAILAAEEVDEDPDEDEDEDGEAPEEEASVSIDSLPDDSELWPGGPLIGEIKEWKQEYGDSNVYVTSITFDNHIVWRTINRAEYKAHIRNMEKLTQSGQLSNADAGLYNEEAISELCILYPRYSRKTGGGEMAGVPAIIAQEVMEASGFVALEVRQL